jgi:hypothetical protein
MKSATDFQEFFHGQAPNKDGLGPPLYVFAWPEVTEADPVLALHNPHEHSVRIQYSTFYPYNLGKNPDLVVYFGDHIGDIENSYIRF